MTYMYEYPQFVKVSLPPNVTVEYRRYGLYAYSEGRQTQQVRNMQFSGIPVLFIPGQGGSLKQVRSLASVSLRKSLGSDLQFHFDYFTLDLNEEYSAMFGGVLQDQTRFAVHAVQRILSLYRKVRPESIVLVGHSMGGMIAKGMFLEPDFPSHAIRLVITLATPHSPVLLTDPLLKQYYDKVSPHWAIRSNNVTVISLGGGVKDLVVRSGLTLTDHADISALTTAVSEVWMSVDHLCILWCKQLVLVLVRSLFDCVDLQTLQISRDHQHRVDVFKYHLLERSAGKRFHDSIHPAQVTLQTQRTEWYELSRPRWHDSRSYLPVPSHILLHLPSIQDMLAVTVSGHKARDWLFTCSHLSSADGGRRSCAVGENLSSLGRIAPTKHRKHKVALVSLQDLRVRGQNYVVIRLPASDEPTSVSYDVFSTRERTMSVSLPKWFAPLQTTVIAETTKEAVFYVLELPQLERPWQAYQLSISVLSCSSATNLSHQAVATLRIPWSHQHYSVVLKNSPLAILPIVLHTARPSEWTGADPYVTLFLDPQCQYSIGVDSSLVDTLAQIVRLYSSHIVAYVAAILLLTLQHQLLVLSTQNHCLLFHHALLEGAKPYYILPAVKIGSTLLALVPEPLKSLLPSADLTTLQQSGLDFMLLPLVLYAVAFSITFLVGLLAYAGVVCSGSTINKFALKFVGKLAGVSRTWTDWLMAAVDKVPCVVSVAMVAILLTSCGGLAMVIGTIYYFMRVCGMYEDYIEQLFFAPVKYLKDTVMARWKGQPRTMIVDDMIREAEDLLSLKNLTEFNFHLTLVLLWGTGTMVYLPSVLVWAHNFKYNPVLDPDPATLSVLVSSVCIALVWSVDTPVCSENSGGMYKHMANLMFVLATLTLIYCPISLYNLPTIITAAFVCLALHQLYEWTCQRFIGSSDETLATTETLGTEESEDDPSKPAIKDSPDSDDETESDESRKNSTSEISMSSYDAVSLAELKIIAREKNEDEESDEGEENEEESENEDDEKDDDDEKVEGDEKEDNDEKEEESENEHNNEQNYEQEKKDLMNKKKGKFEQNVLRKRKQRKDEDDSE
ncbi:GPI inositol-deacylase-like [Macrosteles quadrilineatus]|uniref:GPI inositol-deacylase-like n=1 Tax=Macrosteles quadrilineatus TaxID=74068 RepID=UPI0023E16532|nr:GPI inositol-deacylase-like [Macrosteles quadrilineatus]